MKKYKDISYNFYTNISKFNCKKFVFVHNRSKVKFPLDRPLGRDNILIATLIESNFIINHNI